jgi:AraC-like DNA-binding protein
MAARELARQYPDIDVNPDVLYVDNGRILTSAGAAAGLDLCLHMIRCDLGAEIAALTARLVVMPLERAGGQAQFIVHQPSAPDDSAAMGPLLAWIEKNVHKELSLAAIARQAAMSTRTLSRRFLEREGPRRPSGSLRPAWAAPSNSSKQQVYRWRRSRHIRDSSRRRSCASTSAEASEQVLSRTGAVSGLFDNLG